MPKEHAQLNKAFDAFEKRFEGVLIANWPGVEDRTGTANWGPSEKRSALDRFFKDAENVIETAVHEYFPKLLQVAIAQRRHLGKQSPIAWTKAQVLKRVCAFLNIDEKFDRTSLPREDSRRLVAAVVQIALGVGWPDEIPADFVLPGWLGPQWAWRRATCGPTTQDEAESLPPLSRAETIEWIKRKEHSMQRKLELQIEKNSQDGIIAAAGTQTIGHLSVEQSISVRRRQKRLDARKELIAILKARNQRALARRICELIDQSVSRKAPIHRDGFAPLMSWQGKAGGKRSWVELYDYAKTHNAVRKYVNVVPPLKTSK